MSNKQYIPRKMAANINNYVSGDWSPVLIRKHFESEQTYRKYLVATIRMLTQELERLDEEDTFHKKDFIKLNLTLHHSLLKYSFLKENDNAK